MKYEFSQEWTLRSKEIAQALGMEHVVLDRIACVKSHGSKSRRTIARIHTISKVMQLGMQESSFYTIELISNNFDKQSEDDKARTIIHELLHIPEGFKGGFRQHKPFVTSRKVEELFRRLRSQQSQNRE